MSFQGRCVSGLEQIASTEARNIETVKTGWNGSEFRSDLKTSSMRGAALRRKVD
jgi:hypothetical protein